MNIILTVEDIYGLGIAYRNYIRKKQERAYTIISETVDELIFYAETLELLLSLPRKPLPTTLSLSCTTAQWRNMREVIAEENLPYYPHAEIRGEIQRKLDSYALAAAVEETLTAETTGNTS